MAAPSEGRAGASGGGRKRPALSRALQEGPFSTALRLAIEASGLTLERIQHRLRQRGVHVSVATLSYWQRGRSRPERASSLSAVPVLEEVLELPAGTLSRLASPRVTGRSRRDDTEALDGTRLWPDPAAVSRVLAQVDLSCNHRLTRLGVHDVFRLDGRRRPIALSVRQILRADDSDVDRIVGMYRVEETEMLPELSGVRYGRTGRVRGDAAAGLLVFELFFDRPLPRGATTVLEYDLRFVGEHEVCRNYERKFRYPTREYLALVEFHQDAVPARCYCYEKDSSQGRERRQGELWVGTSDTVHLFAHDVSPGILGIEWEWV